MNISDKQSYTFWEFLERPVTIPRLQRNYVQGTIVNGKIRAKNLVKAVLDAVLSKDGKIALDLVYGSRPHDEAFHPIDGQQRLTLLWILHWYIWKRACIEKDGDIENFEEIRQKLNNFTYATRASSRDFLKALVDEKTFPLIKDAPLKKEIVESRFFFTDWVFDPTISSILNVIQEMDDRFQDEKEVCFEKIWNRLSSQQDVITFRICDTVKLKQTEELYIKMNGRGKLLESIENLKADFIKELGESNVKFEDKYFIYFWNQLNEIQKNKYYENKNLEDEVGPDGAIYRLICRFFLDRYAQEWSKLDGVKGFSYSEFSNQKSWEELINLESSGEYYTIDSFKIRDIFSTKIPKSNNEEGTPISEKVNGCLDALELKSLTNEFFKFIDQLCKIQDQGIPIGFINFEATPYWNDDAQRERDSYKSLIPEANLSAGKFNEEHCAVFHAVMLYINKAPAPVKNDADIIEKWKDNYKAWLHFVWNIIANCSSNILEIIKLLDKTADEIFTKNKAIGVYSGLKDINPENPENHNMYWQLVEEIEKAAYRCGSTPKISLIDKLEKEFEGQIYVFYKDARKVSSPIDQKVLDERYQKWDSYKKSGLRDKTKSLLQRFCNPDELIRFEFPKEGEINLYNGKKLITHYPEICLRLLRDEPYKWTKENHILEALLDPNGSNNLLEITEKRDRNSRYRFSKDWDRYNLHMPYSGGWHIPMDQRSVKIGKMIQSLSREWHNNYDTEWPDWIAEQPNDWKPKCNGYIRYDLANWRTPIGKERKIYFYLFKNIFASHKINPSDIDDNIGSDCKSWGIDEEVEKLEELLKEILNESITFVRIDYGTNTP